MAERRATCVEFLSDLLNKHDVALVEWLLTVHGVENASWAKCSFNANHTVSQWKTCLIADFTLGAIKAVKGLKRVSLSPLQM